MGRPRVLVMVILMSLASLGAWGQTVAGEVVLVVEVDPRVLQGGPVLLNLTLQDRREFDDARITPRYSRSVEITPESLGEAPLELVFTGVEAGEFVVSGYIDTNRDGRLTMGLFGPTEPWGMAGLRRPLLARPRFDSLKLSLPRDVSSDNNKILLKIN